MAHLSNTMTRIADEESGAAQASLDPLPPVGSSVTFRLRGRDFRNGADTFAAIVTRQHLDKGTIDVVVVLDADDFMSQKEIPRETEESGWGWSPVAGGDSDALAALERFKDELGAVLFGSHAKVEESVYDVLIDFEERIAALEAKPPAKTKRKYTRRAKG